jgi:hypothetical protein
MALVAAMAWQFTWFVLIATTATLPHHHQTSYALTPLKTPNKPPHKVSLPSPKTDNPHKPSNPPNKTKLAPINSAKANARPTTLRPRRMNALPSTRRARATTVRSRTSARIRSISSPAMKSHGLFKVGSTGLLILIVQSNSLACTPPRAIPASRRTTAIPNSSIGLPARHQPCRQMGHMCLARVLRPGVITEQMNRHQPYEDMRLAHRGVANAFGLRQYDGE